MAGGSCWLHPQPHWVSAKSINTIQPLGEFACLNVHILSEGTDLLPTTCTSVTTSSDVPPPAALLLLLFPLLPESPRYLAAKGQSDEAAKILQRISKVNGKALPAGRLVSEQAGG